MIWDGNTTFLLRCDTIIFPALTMIGIAPVLYQVTLMAHDGAE